MEMLPYPIKFIGKYIYSAVPFRFRRQRSFWNTYNLLQESQWWSREKLEAYQLIRLRKLLQHAYENVPYYKNLFEEKAVDPYNFKRIKDLKKLPFLTKDIVRNNLHNLIAENYPETKIEKATTGGTTDVPLSFYQEKKVADSIEDAFIFTLWERVGFKIGDKRVSIRGHIPKARKRKKIYEYDPVHRCLFFSSLDMKNDKLQEYISIIREFQPAFFHVYPSVISIMAKYIKKKGIKPFKKLKAVLCCSEILYPYQRNLLEEVFQCRVYSWYGHAEKAVLAGECESNTDYHIFPEYGITEIIDDNNNSVSNENKCGEIIATGFNNYVLPFIRYRTGDLAVSSEKTCDCGRKYKLLNKVTGRGQDYFVGAEGSLITFIWADKPLWNFKSKINAYQYIQNEPGKVILKIDAYERMKPSDIERIKKIFSDLYDDLEITIAVEENILRTRTGKIKYLIQNVPVED